MGFGKGVGTLGCLSWPTGWPSALSFTGEVAGLSLQPKTNARSSTTTKLANAPNRLAWTNKSSSLSFEIYS
jgi:hypothetical protein